MVGLGLPEVVALRPRLRAEVSVYAAAVDGNNLSLTSGIADAVAIDADGNVDTIIDWKSDVALTAETLELYRAQVRNYLTATGASAELIVFVTTCRIERVTMSEIRNT